MTIQSLSRRKFVSISASCLFGTLAGRRFALAQQHHNELILYVGTYTSGKSEGIYIYRMNRSSGELRFVETVKSINPSFLAIDHRKRFLYAVNEISDFGGHASGAVSAFAIDSATGSLKFLNQQESMGSDPCHLVLAKKAGSLLVANYTGGNVAVLTVNPNGALGPVTDVKQHQGSSVKEQQKGPHAHCVLLDDAHRRLLVADLGLDRVMIYQFDPKTRKLTAGTQPWIQLNPGTGPRHLAMHPNGRFVFVINELNSTITSLKYDGSHGTLTEIETVSTLPSTFTGTSYCADIHFSPSGKFLYGSNRGDDSIVSFAVSPDTGRLTLLGHVPTGGKWPRNFTIDPTGKFLLVANQRTDNVVSFRIDANSGQLVPTGRSYEIPAPVCLKFA